MTTSGVYAVPPGADFARALRLGLLARLGDGSPERLARTRIFTNTRRAARRLGEEFRDMDAVILPQILVIGDIDRDPALPLAAPPPPAFAREFRLMQLVRRLLEAQPQLGPTSGAYGLAASLCALMDELESEGCQIEDIERLPAAEFSEHWQVSLQFLEIVKQFWTSEPGLTQGGSDQRIKAAIGRLAAAWQAAPPQSPVIFAGSTGSRSVSRDLMRAVLGLEQGFVVLPGFDRHLDARSWDALGASSKKGAPRASSDHPQSVFCRLLGKLGLAPVDVGDWTDQAAPNPVPNAIPNPERNEIVSLAMRPAPVTDDWISQQPMVEAHASAAFADLQIMQARTPREEAQAIALRLRGGLEQGHTCALITPDASLARRVAAQLKRWDITADDSGGVPLNLTPLALFWDMIARYTREGEVTDLMSLLKHPFCSSGAERGPHLLAARDFDERCLRKGGPALNSERAATWAAKRAEHQDWLARLNGALNALPDAAARVPLDVHIAAMRAGMVALATLGGGAPDELHKKAADRAFQTLLDELSAAAVHGGDLSFFEAMGIIAREAATRREPDEEYKPDGRIVIWGQLEARVQGADVVVLAGLNEGVWPSQPKPDHWINRATREKLGLSLPEHRIGLSAHDFQIGLGNARVVLSRAVHDGSAPSVAARWFVRLNNLMNGCGASSTAAWKAACARGDQVLELARAIDRPALVDPEPRPCLSPPLSARPREVSITDVERHDRDPYAIYARKILGLKPLDVLGRPPDARDRGNAAHEVMEAFIKAEQDQAHSDQGALFAGVADQVMRDQVPWASVRALWLSRIMRHTDDLLGNEARRREVSAPRPDWLEQYGRLEVALPNGRITLIARADRLDEMAKGGIGIYDYKFTKPPDKRLPDATMQLMLEAQIANEGGFDKIGARIPSRAEVIVIGKPEDDVLIEDLDGTWRENWTKFTALMDGFLSGQHNYGARYNPTDFDRPGDFDHLARFGEWSDGDDLKLLVVT